jgi:choline dehydrogenase-like flavoprotein
MAHYDAIVIGTGAGGGTLARHLAPSGKKILLIERGGWLPREPQNVSAEEEIPIAGCAHQAGTCRFGTDPATSVPDVNCKAL